MMRVTVIRVVDHSLTSYTLKDFLKLFEPIRSHEVSPNNTIAITLTDYPMMTVSAANDCLRSFDISWAMMMQSVINMVIVADAMEVVDSFILKPPSLYVQLWI